MIEISVTKFSRNLRKIFDRIEYQREEIILIRNKQRIFRIIPGVSHLKATEAMSDLYQTIANEAAETWLEDSRIKNSLKDEMVNKWDS
jgi:hypothetical protein